MMVKFFLKSKRFYGLLVMALMLYSDYKQLGWSETEIGSQVQQTLLYAGWAWALFGGWVAKGPLTFNPNRDGEEQ